MTFRPSVAVFDYGIGNLRSAQKALEFAGAEATLTSDKSILKEADGVVLPGVGAFGRCAEALKESDLFDLAASMAKTAALGGKPFLGICVGMQLLYSGSEESPSVDGLGVISEEVKALEGDVKIPQMQWNELKFNVSHPMFEGVERDTWVYFVHRLIPAACRWFPYRLRHQECHRALEKRGRYIARSDPGAPRFPCRGCRWKDSRA